MAVFCPLETVWGDVGTWVSGIGSLAAVVAALHLSNRADRPNAKATLRTVIFPPDMTPVLAFEVSNLGTHPLRVTSCFIEFSRPIRRPFQRFLKYPAAIANNWIHPMNWRLPADVQRGATFLYGTSGEPFAEFLASPRLPAWLIVRCIRAGVSTPWGSIYARIDKDQRQKFVEQILAERARAK